MLADVRRADLGVVPYKPRQDNLNQTLNGERDVLPNFAFAGVSFVEMMVVMDASRSAAATAAYKNCRHFPKFLTRAV